MLDYYCFFCNTGANKVSFIFFVVLMNFKKMYTVLFLTITFFGCTFADSLSDVDVAFCDALSGATVQSGVIASGNALSYQIGVEQD